MIEREKEKNDLIDTWKREKEKGVNFNVIKMGKERVTLEWIKKERKNKERKREKKRELLTLKHDILVYFESWKRKRENRGWTIFEGSHLRCMKKERKKRRLERDRERDNRNLMRERKEERSSFNEKKKFTLVNKEWGNLIIYSNKKRRKGKRKEKKGGIIHSQNQFKEGRKEEGRGILKENQL